MKPSSLAAVPLAGILVAFICGIILAEYSAIGLPLETICLCAAILFFFYCLASQCNYYWRPRIKSTILFLLLTLIGAGALVSSQNNWERDHFSKRLAAQNNFVVKALEHTKSGLIVEVVKMNQRHANGKLLLVGKKVEATPHLNYLVINGTPKRISEPKNPYAFDFAQYCERLGFSYKIIPVYEPTILSRDSGFSILGFAHRLRHLLLDRLDHYVTDPKLRAVAKAMLLGDRNALDGELKEAYVDAGIIHVLAISGLHLGIVYLALLMLWSKVPGPQRDHDLLRAAIVLLLLWLFVLLSGCSSSAVRAATMFSFFEVAKLIGRGKYSINTLCASALFMLVINPNFLFNVGFQLSYLAVFGILLLQRPIENLIIVKHKLLKSCWQLISLSLAAQVFTLPLTIYYFHQFPLLFAVTSFLAVPLTAIVVKIGLLFLALHNVPFIGASLLVVLEAALSLINLIAIDFTGTVDLVVRNIWISPWQCALWFGVMATAAWLIICKCKRALISCVSLVFLLQVALYLQDRQVAGQQFFTCYFLEGKSFGVYVENRHAVKLMQVPIKAYEERRCSQAHLLRHGVTRDTTLCFSEHRMAPSSIVSFAMGDTRCCLISDSTSTFAGISECDLLWMNGDGIKSTFAGRVGDKSVIVDGATSAAETIAFVRRHQNEFKTIYDVRNEGAIQLDLKSTL